MHNDLTILTKDGDFRQRSFLLGHPPKIVWLRTGNCTTATIESLVRQYFVEIELFLADERKSFFRSRLKRLSRKAG